MFIALGGSIGYWQGNVSYLVDDIGALKPSIFIGVPRVFDRIYNRVTDQVRPATQYYMRACLVVVCREKGRHTHVTPTRSGSHAVVSVYVWYVSVCIFSDVLRTV
jgi:long-subunit acyl-CoA synthetase (AMP-forming)